MMEGIYKAIYEIDCGVSNGQVVRPDFYIKSDAITAKCENDAMLKSFEIAEGYLKEHFCNPSKGYVQVRLQKLLNPQGKLLKQYPIKGLEVKFEDECAIFNRNSLGKLIFE